MKKLLMVMMGVTLSIILAACGGGNADKENEGSGDTTAVDAEALVNKSCIGCHGDNLEGKGNASSLNDVGSRLSEDEILDVIENGRTDKGMPAGLYKGEEAEAIAKWLADKK